MPLEQAVETAIEYCIRHDILKDFLLKQRAEVVKMSIFEYDEEREIELIRRDEREIGEQIGIEKAIRTIISFCRKHGDTREQTIQELCENCELTRDDAEKKMQLYWK